MTHELIQLELDAWTALSTDGSTAAAFYERVLAGDVLMLLPGDLMMSDRAAIVDSMKGAAWDSFEISDERVLQLTDDSAVVAYRATARRGTDTYSALFNSTYVRENGAWKLALHQQTPN